MEAKKDHPEGEHTKQSIAQAAQKNKQFENMERPNIQYEEELSEKAARKIRENPMVPIGMVGFFAAAAYGIHNFRNRPKNLSPSLYVLRFRVYAQSIAVGCMAAGIGYTVLRDKLFKKDDTPHPHQPHAHQPHRHTESKTKGKHADKHHD